MTNPTPDGNVYQFGAKAQPTTPEPFKEMVIDALCGANFPTMDIANKYTRMKLARFSGNQWNEAWEWERGQLIHLEVEQLQDLYEQIKQAQWDIERRYAARTLVAMLKAEGPVSEIPA
jgi:hypothetical protein